ncbi:MAG: type II secretion system GspH family protein [Proteobacteria bacterium]|nr:type II secretion system GspH family protein [Pseudomonadota bacterium]
MKSNSFKEKGFTLIEVAIVIAISAVIGSVILRFFYGEKLREWSRSFWLSFGIEPFWPNVIIGIACAIFIIRTQFGKNRKKTKSTKSKFR